MLRRGDKFERYTIEELLGHGGMGHVYRAEDPRLGRRVALKVISEGVSTPDVKARLVREARAAAALDHPNAVAVFDVGDDEDTPYIVMELVDGRTLRSAIGEASALEERLSWLADVGRALSAAHQKGLVHRDVKPENVMIRKDGVVKVLDFGIARRESTPVDPGAPTQASLPTLTVEGVKLGTPLYMAPEQIRGDLVDGRADQFAWGVVAYELLTGRLPWRGSDALAAMASVLTDPVERKALDAASVPRAVQDVLLRAMSKRPEARFESMNEAVSALEAAARGQAPSVTQAQLFSTSEVQEVLSLALERQAQGSPKLGFDDLIAVAEEVGIDTASLRAATREVRQTSIDTAKRDAWVRRQRRDLARHAGVYAIVNAAILVLGLVLLSFTPWWIWFIPLLGWGVGLAIHALVALTANEDDRRDHEEGLQMWREGKQRKHERRLAELQRSGRPKRLEAAEKKLRVAETGHDHAVEDDEAEERARQSRRRR